MRRVLLSSELARPRLRMDHTNETKPLINSWAPPGRRSPVGHLVTRLARPGPFRVHKARRGPVGHLVTQPCLVLVAR